MKRRVLAVLLFGLLVSSALYWIAISRLVRAIAAS
jgi:hypothetical protein